MGSVLTLEAQIVALTDEVEKLRKVADVAAFCCIDIRTNLSDANKEYMDGTISRGAFDYVLMREEALHRTLHEAGFTSTNKFFDIPERPKDEG